MITLMTLNINMITNLIIIILITFGICRIIQRGNIFESFRNRIRKYTKIYDFITCMQCFSFWVSISLTFLFPVFPIYIFYLVGFIASPICEIIDNKYF